MADIGYSFVCWRHRHARLFRAVEGRSRSVLRYVACAIKTRWGDVVEAAFHLLWRILITAICYAFRVMVSNCDAPTGDVEKMRN